MLNVFGAWVFRPNTQALFRLLLIVSLGAPFRTASAEPDSAQPLSVPPDKAASGQIFGGAESAESPMRITLAQEFTYKVEEPVRTIKNRSSIRMEYSKYFLENFFLQFDGKATGFWGFDHRLEAEGTDTSIPQAYVQTSLGKTSIKAGIQTLAWGESLAAPITDVVSPRDNRELFNFNLDELRIGQTMVVVDQYSESGRWTFFLTPHPYFNKNPAKGDIYYFLPFDIGGQIEGDKGVEYGASWRVAFASADITFMAASLIDNNYALRMDASGLVTRVRERFSLAGMVFNYAMKEVVVRGEMAMKSPQPYNNAALQIVKKDELDAYLAVEYAPSSTLNLSLAGTILHVIGWDNQITSVPRNRRSFVLSVTKLLMHDDLSINVLNFYNRPYSSNLTILTASYKWSDNLTLGFNVVYPYTNNERSVLWNVRDQKQIGVSVQYQF
jgi:Protein of unknown function (DUF1302)